METIEELNAKHEGKQNLAQGYLEVKVAENTAAKEKMNLVLHEEALDRLEEEQQNVESLLARGAITAEEARRIRARQKMHLKSEQTRKSTGQEKTSKAALAASGFVTTEHILEEALRNRNHNWLADFVWKTFRLYKVENLISWERRRREHPSFKHPFPAINSIAKHSSGFEAIMFFVVSFNALLIGLQLSDAKEESRFLPWCERTIMAIFIVEITMRVLADGWLWFLDWANTVDVVLILGTGVLPTFVFKPFLDMQETPVLKLGQALRCMRLVRILKRLRARFRTLWMLISGIIESGLTLMWTGLIFIVVLYMFSICFITFLVKSDWQYDPELQAVVDVHFKDVLAAMFTLFQFLTLDSWTGVCRPLHKSYTFPMPAFMLYIAIAVMVLNNLVVAVIVNNAFARTENDEELQASIKKEEVQNELDNLFELFELLDADDSEYLTQEEYELGLQKHDEVWDKLRLLQVEDKEIESLWEFLDFPEEIGAEIWAHELRSLKGPVRAKDSFAVSCSLQRQQRRIQQAARQLAIHKTFSYELLSEAIGIQRDMRQAAVHLQEFVKYLDACVPSGAVKIKEKDVIAFSDAMSRKVAELIDPDRGRDQIQNGQDQLRNGTEAPIQAFLTPAEAFPEPKKKQKAIGGSNRPQNAIVDVVSLQRAQDSVRKQGRVATVGLFAEEQPLQLEDVEDIDFEQVARANVGRRGSKLEGGGEQAMLGWSPPPEAEDTSGGLRQRSPKGSE